MRILEGIKRLRREFYLGLGLGFIGSGLLMLLFGGGVNSGQEKTIPITELQALDQRIKDLEQMITEMNNRLPPESAFPPTSENTEVIVPAGATIDDIGNILVQAGLIADKEAFVRYVEKQGWQGRLQVGRFQIKKGASVDEITRILTGQF